MTANTLKMHSFSLFILLVVSSILFAITSYPTFHFGYDFEFHYIMYDAFKDQISRGELYPRWLDDVHSGFGGLNFFFYSPLYYYVQYIIDFIIPGSTDTLTLMGIGGFITTLLCAISFYCVGCRISTPRVSLIASIAYICIFFRLWFEFFLRSSVTASFAGIWIPIVFYSAYNAHKSYKFFFLYALSLSLLILSHLLTAILVCLLLAIHELYVLYQEKNMDKRMHIFIKFSAASLLGAGLSCFYLIPCASYIDFINKDFFWEDTFHYTNWFLTPFADPQKNLPYVRQFFFYIGLWEMLVLLIVTLISKKYMDQSKKGLTTFLFILMGFFFFMTTPWSTFIWQSFSVISIIQLPYRFFILVEFLFIFSMLIIYASKFGKTALALDSLKLILLSYILISVVFISALNGNGGDSKLTSIEQLKESSPRIDNKYSNSEYVIPNDSLEIPLLDFVNVSRPEFFIDIDHSEAQLVSNIPRKKNLHIKANTPSTIQIRQFYFPGWAVVDSKTGYDYSQEYNLRSMSPYGQVAFDVPEGEHRLSLVIPLLYQEKLGIIVSLISMFLLMIGGLIWGYKKKSN